MGHVRLGVSIRYQLMLINGVIKSLPVLFVQFPYGYRAGVYFF